MNLRATLNEDATGDNLSRSPSGGADADPLASLQPACDFSVNDNLAGLNVRVHATVRSNGDRRAVQVDVAVKFGVNQEIFPARDFAFDRQGTGQMGTNRRSILGRFAGKRRRRQGRLNCRD